eukprot:1157879-Pelagomonas_calceolata.AAC.3
MSVSVEIRTSKPRHAQKDESLQSTNALLQRGATLTEHKCIVAERNHVDKQSTNALQQGGNHVDKMTGEGQHSCTPGRSKTHTLDGIVQNKPQAGMLRFLDR